MKTVAVEFHETERERRIHSAYAGLGEWLKFDNKKRWSIWWRFAEKLGLWGEEYLLPRIHKRIEVGEFPFAQNPSTISGDELRTKIEELRPWEYYFEFPGGIETRAPARANSTHRFRSNLISETVCGLLGDTLGETEVLDLACNCGPFTLDLANRGAKHAHGCDLRQSNIDKALFLQRVFNVPRTSFEVRNLRDIDLGGKKYGVVLCLGVLYHVTFPYELVRFCAETCTEFCVIDTNVSKEPFSAYHVMTGCDTSRQGFGEHSFEFLPTYRAVIDTMYSAGFSHLIEVTAESEGETSGYARLLRRCLIGFKADPAPYLENLASACAANPSSRFGSFWHHVITRWDHRGNRRVKDHKSTARNDLAADISKSQQVPQQSKQSENLPVRLVETELCRERDLEELGKWSDRLAQELERLLKSNRWRLGCWLSLKPAGNRSKEARRFAHLISTRPKLHYRETMRTRQPANAVNPKLAHFAEAGRTTAVELILPESKQVIHSAYSQMGEWLKFDSHSRWSIWLRCAAKFGLWAEEYLLPRIHKQIAIGEYPFAQRQPTLGPDELRTRISKLKPWEYYFEFPDGIETRAPARANSTHRFRSSLISETVCELLGDALGETEVLDLACNCGPFTLDMANRGANHAHGCDLRQANIDKAFFLQRAFDIPRTSFEVRNLRDIDLGGKKYGVVLCLGVLYHVTFPYELVKFCARTCTDFCVIDTNVSREPFSAYDVMTGCDTSRQGFGEHSFEFLPTYRAVIDTMYSAGFTHLVEVTGESEGETSGYARLLRRCLIGFKADPAPYLSNLATACSAKHASKFSKF